MTSVDWRRTRTSAWAGLAATLSCLGSAGCSALGPCDTSDEGNPAQRYVDGTTQNGVYMSSPWEGPLLGFPGGKRYELVHGLGCTPREVEIWVSFSEQGTASSNIAPSSGNMSVVQKIDDEKIRVKNDTCSDMYLLVTATCGAEAVVDADAGASSLAPDAADGATP